MTTTCSTFRAPRRRGAALVLVASLALPGCASVPSGHDPHPQDPWEGYNRSMMRFNDGVDEAVFKPVAKTYQDIVPKPVRTGVNNFFGNIGDLWSMANFLLQGRGELAYNHMVRFTTNSVLGLGGLLDIATEAQIPRVKQDFGQTMRHWGIEAGPYLVLPLLGPSTLRDTVALPVDWSGYLLNDMHPVSYRNTLFGLRHIDARASLLGASDTLDAMSLDRYSLLRAFYLRQRNVAHDAHDDDAGRIEDYDD